MTAPPAETRTGAPHRPGRADAPATVSGWPWLPVLLGGAVLIVGLLDNGDHGFDPAWLLVPLNAVFLTVVPLIVAWVSVTAYRATGVPAVLAVGAGMLAVGVGGGAVPGVLRSVQGPNAQVTMHNVAVLIAAAALLVAAVTSVSAFTPSPDRQRGRDVAVVYSVVVAALAVLLVLLLTGRTPVFFDPDAGGATTVRQVVLGTAIEMFLVATVIWAVGYSRMRTTFARWYLLGLALFTVGLTAVFFQHAVGNVVGWVGGGAQYAAAVYFLAAVLSLRVSVTRRTGGRSMGMVLFQSGVRFQPLVESSAEAMIVLGPDRRVLYWNGAAQRLFGYTAADTFGQHILDFIARQAPGQPSRADLDRFLRGDSQPRSDRWEGTLATRSGAEFPAEVARYDNAGGTELICVIRDVTERVQAQTALAAAHTELAQRAALLQEAQRLARIGSWTWTADTDQETWTPQMYAITGIDPDTGPPTLDRILTELSHPDDTDPATAVTDEAMRNHQPFEFARRLLLPTGEIRHVLVRGEPVLDDHGTLIGLRGTLQDVTALRHAEQEAEKASQWAAREQYAREVNDSIVQGLVTAEMVLDLGEVDHAREVIATTSLRARRWIGELLTGQGPLQPGRARRRTTTDHQTSATQ